MSSLWIVLLVVAVAAYAKLASGRGEAAASSKASLLALVAVLATASCSQEQAQQIAGKAAVVHLTRQLDSFANAMANQVADQPGCAGWRSSILQAAERWKVNPGSAGARYEIIQIRDAAKATGCVVSR